ESSDDKAVTLPVAVEVEDISFAQNDISCGPGGIKIDGFIVNFSECDFGDHEEVIVKVTTRVKRLDYTLSGVARPDAGDWKIWIDDKETNRFTRQGATIKFADKDLPMGATVKIRFSL